MRSALTLFLFFCSLHCFSQNIIREAIKSSDLQDIAYQLKLQPGSEQTIKTTFTITEDGTLSDIKASSEYPELENEAIIILKRVKKLYPKKVRDVFVTQQISLPIVFKVETEEFRKLRLRRENRRAKTN